MPYVLYRTSVPVQGWTLTLPIPLFPLYAVRPVKLCNLPSPIPLLPLRAVRPVQSLSVCTTVHLTLPIPVLPLCAVRPVQSLSACTTVHFNFTYTSNPSLCRTACTEPQCLYNGALCLYLYFYSPYVPYGLYRASVPVQRCTLPLPPFNCCAVCSEIRSPESIDTHLCNRFWSSFELQNHPDFASV